MKRPAKRAIAVAALAAVPALANGAPPLERERVSFEQRLYKIFYC